MRESVKRWLDAVRVELSIADTYPKGSEDEQQGLRIARDLLIGTIEIQNEPWPK